MSLLEQYQKDLAIFEAQHLAKLRYYLREMLEMLPNQDMEIPLHSDKVDGNAIHIGNYTDHINKVNGKGETTVYNNVDCDPAFSTRVYDDGITIYSFDLATTAEIVKCVEAYFKKIENKYATFNDKTYLVGDSRKTKVDGTEIKLVELFDVESEISSGGTMGYSIYMCESAVGMLPRASHDEIAIAEAFYATQA